VSLEDSQAEVWAGVVAEDAQLVADTGRVCFDFAAKAAEMLLEQVGFVVDFEGYIERAILTEQLSYAHMEDLPVRVMPSKLDLGVKCQLFVSKIVCYLNLEMVSAGRSSAAIGSV
jgi:hypothetical protein